MITEKKFVSGYTSFWKTALPLGERYVRSINLNKERFTTPLASKTEANRHGLINDLSVRIFSVINSKGSVKPSELAELVLGALNYAKGFIENTKRDLAAFSAEETKEAKDIADRLRIFTKYKKVTVAPEFEGSGFVDTCAGDLYLDNTLYEIKAGERSFRLIDVRQLLTYCALNYAASSYDISRIGLVNPRAGVFFQEEVPVFIKNLTGLSAVEVFSNIQEFLSQQTGYPRIL